MQSRVYAISFHRATSGTRSAEPGENRFRTFGRWMCFLNTGNLHTLWRTAALSSARFCGTNRASCTRDPFFRKVGQRLSCSGACRPASSRETRPFRPRSPGSFGFSTSAKRLKFTLGRSRHVIRNTWERSVYPVDDSATWKRMIRKSSHKSEYPRCE